MNNENVTEATTVVEEKKSNKTEKLLNEFVEKHLEGTRYVRDFELTISDETKTFGIATNNILYDFDISKEEFEEKVDFLHNTKTQDTSGVKYQYRVIKKKGDSFIAAFKSDSYVAGAGKVGRTREIVEV